MDTSSQPNIDENVSELVEETIEEGSEGSLSEKDDSYGEHETAFEEPNNGDSQEDESVDVQGRSPSARKKRKVVSNTETENKCHIVSTGRFESSSSILFAKLHLGLDSVNVLLRTLFEEISVGKETHILRNLFSLILRVSFFPNASDWPESVQEQLDEFLSNWDFSDNSLENMLISLPEDMLHPKLCLNLKDKASKRFRSRYEAFWKNLAKIAPRSIIDNQSFFNPLVDQLALFTSSSFRNLRYVASLSCFSLGNGFISSEESARSEHSLFEIHETQSKSNQRNMTDSSNKNSNLTGIAEYLDKIFNKVFVLRYRDVAPEIRALAISYLGEWILNLPRSFLDDRFLKYIGWMLNDKASEVRTSSLLVIGNLLKIQENWPRMQLFLRRFRSRICEMMQDKDVQVARNAVQVIEIILQIGSLTEDEKKLVFKISATENRKPVRDAAQTITNQIIKDLTNVEVSRIDSAVVGSRRNESSETLVRLARMISNDKLRNKFVSNCLESLCKEVAVLQDWETYFAILLPEQNDMYSQEERSTVGKILLELAQSLSSKASFVSSSFHVKSKRIGKQQSKETSAFQQLCRCILNNIYSCLTYNQADPMILNFVVPLIRQVDDETYRLYCIPVSIKEIATKLKELIDRHVSCFPLLSECLLSLNHLSQISDHSFRKEAEEVLAQLHDEIHSSLHELATMVTAHSNQEYGTSSKFSATSISASLLKALAYAAYGSELKENAVDDVFDMCENVDSLVTLFDSEECILTFVKLAHFCIIQRWQGQENDSNLPVHTGSRRFEQDILRVLKLLDHICQAMLFVDQPCSKLLLYINVISCLQLLFFVKDSRQDSIDMKILEPLATRLAEKCSVFFIESLREYIKSSVSKSTTEHVTFQGNEHLGMCHFFRCYAQVSACEDFPFRCLAFSLVAVSEPNIQSAGKRWLKRANFDEIARGLLEYLRHFLTDMKELKTICNELQHRFMRIDQHRELISFISCFVTSSFNIDEKFHIASESIKRASEHILIPLCRKLSPRSAEQCYEEVLNKLPQLRTLQEDRYSFVLLIDTIHEIAMRRNSERRATLERNEGFVIANE